MPAAWAGWPGFSGCAGSGDRPMKSTVVSDKGLASWNDDRKAANLIDATRIFTLYEVGRIDEGIAMARLLLKRKRATVGIAHVDTALAQGMLGLGLAKSGNVADARKELEAATPLLLASLDGEFNDDDAITATTREQRVQSVIEGYIELLASTKEPDATAQAFLLAEGIRGRSVQKALVASAARFAAGSPALAELARQEQDLAKQVNAEIGLLNNALAQPPQKRDPQAIDALRAHIEELRVERATTRDVIAKHFTDYAELTSPQPPTVQEVAGVLQPGEAYISIYLGHEYSFVWSVRHDGSLQFAVIDQTATEIATTVAVLRKALEPNAGTLEGIPPFDVVLAHRLYARVLEPVAGAWSSARNLIVATNGALGLLPLGLLPTKDAKVSGTGPMFAGYRSVPWLARTHGVTMVPSGAAFLDTQGGCRRRRPRASA